VPTGKLVPSPPPGALNRAAAIAAAQISAQGTGALLGWQQVPITATANLPAVGQATATLSPPAEGQAYLVERIQVQTNSSASTSASVQVGGYESDFTDAANHDIGEEQPPIVVPSGAVFSIVWSNLNPGDQCTALVQYRVVAQ
jgi:hypothetical protein